MVIITEETKRKISASNKGRKTSELAIQRSREFHLGKPLSEETKKKISKVLTGKIVISDTRQKLSISHRKFNDEQETEIFQLRQSGASYKELTDKYNCSRRTIYNILKRAQ